MIPSKLYNAIFSMSIFCRYNLRRIATTHIYMRRIYSTNYTRLFAAEYWLGIWAKNCLFFLHQEMKKKKICSTCFIANINFEKRNFNWLKRDTPWFISTPRQTINGMSFGTAIPVYTYIIKKKDPQEIEWKLPGLFARNNNRARKLV